MSRWRLALTLTVAAAVLAAAGIGFINRDQILGAAPDPQTQAKVDPLDVVFVADISSPARRVGEDLTRGFNQALAASPFTCSPISRPAVDTPASGCHSRSTPAPT